MALAADVAGAAAAMTNMRITDPEVQSAAALLCCAFGLRPGRAAPALVAATALCVSWSSHGR